MIALLVVDMQAALFTEDTPRFDAEGVVLRINELARGVRDSGGTVIFIQHEGPKGDPFEAGSPGWEILEHLERETEDPAVGKTACDAFYKTELDDLLNQLGIQTLLITGCATDFCVDTTVRAAASRDYRVAVASDGHTTADRPHLDARTIIEHHNHTWKNLILPGNPVDVRPAALLLKELQTGNPVPRQP